MFQGVHRELGSGAYSRNTHVKYEIGIKQVPTSFSNLVEACIFKISNILSDVLICKKKKILK